MDAETRISGAWSDERLQSEPIANVLDLLLELAGRSAMYGTHEAWSEVRRVRAALLERITAAPAMGEMSTISLPFIVIEAVAHEVIGDYATREAAESALKSLRAMDGTKSYSLFIAAATVRAVVIARALAGGTHGR